MDLLINAIYLCILIPETSCQKDKLAVFINLSFYRIIDFLRSMVSTITIEHYVFYYHVERKCRGFTLFY